MKVETDIRQAIESSKKKKLYENIKKKKTLSKLELDVDTPSYIKDVRLFEFD